LEIFPVRLLEGRQGFKTSEEIRCFCFQKLLSNKKSAREFFFREFSLAVLSLGELSSSN
jgi:hypothetical protein